MQEFIVELPNDEALHEVTIYKATEPGTGLIVFSGLACESLHEQKPRDGPKIEFIGNSITCGMSADPEEIPCGEGNWYDQHNSYCTYGARIARELGAEFMLSAASGCGIYRHWNRDQPNLPEIYDQTYLNFDTTRKWNFASWKPDIVSICLGTNDLSDGDGVTPRLPFDADKFVTEYVLFIERIFHNYGQVQIILLSSPMLNGEKASVLSSCLHRIKAHFDAISHRPPIRLFIFENMTPNGCGYHPDCDDHQKMAEVLLPVFKEFSSKHK